MEMKMQNGNQMETEVRVASASYPHLHILCCALCFARHQFIQRSFPSKHSARGINGSTWLLEQIRVPNSF